MPACSVRKNDVLWMFQRNSNETWCLSIPLPWKVLSAGFPFSLLVNYRSIAPGDTTPPLFSPLTVPNFSSTAKAFPRWFARHGLREGADISISHDWPKSTSLCCELLRKSAKSNWSRGEARSVGTCDWLRLRAGPRARRLVKRGLVGAAVSQREQTSPLYPDLLRVKNSQEFRTDWANQLF